MTGLTKTYGLTSSDGRTISIDMSQQSDIGKSKTLTNIAQTIMSKASSITDEHGQRVDKEAFAMSTATGKAGTPFGSIAPISVETTIGGGYRVNGTTSEGKKYTFTVDKKDAESVNQEIGQFWRETELQRKSNSLSATDQEVASKIRSASNVDKAVEQSSESWAKVETLKESERKILENALSNKQEYDTAFVTWYADSKYGYISGEERYLTAASDLSDKLSRGEDITGLMQRYYQQKGFVTNTSGRVNGPDMKKAPDFNSIPINIQDKKHEIIDTQKDIPEPTISKVNTRETIAKSGVTLGLKEPSHYNSNIFLTGLGIKASGDSLAKDPWGMLFPTGSATNVHNPPPPPPTFTQSLGGAFVKAGKLLETGITYTEQGQDRVRLDMQRRITGKFNIPDAGNPSKGENFNMRR